jgi:integral membrane protein (TIGR00529 family)
MVFFLVLICIRKKLSLGNAFMLGAVFLSVLFGLRPLAMLKSMLTSILDPKTLSIAVIVSLILVLSNSMELGFVNYWFRHIWEHWWPLYPGILLTTVMTDLSLPAIMLLMCPFTLIAVWLGYRMLKNSELNKEVTDHNPHLPLRPFLKELVPILIAIIPGLSMGLLFSTTFPAFPISKEIGLILALCMAIGWVWYENGTSNHQIWSTLRNPRLLRMMYMIVAILIFKGILADSKAAGAVGQELVKLHVPLVLIALALPFLVGMSGGIVIAFVGSTFPILIPLIRSFGEAQFLPAYVMLVLASGFAGVMMSPLHLCFLLSNEHFGVTMGSVYKHLWWPCVSLIAASIIYFLVLHWLSPWI